MKTTVPKRRKRLAPYSFPTGFVLVVDTREQRDLFKRIPKGLVICSNTLKTGDYSIKGFENMFAIERKQMSDFYSFIGKERGGDDKTLKKLMALKECEFASLVIEASEDMIYKGYEYSKVSPQTARSFLTSCRVKYGVHVYMNSLKSACQRYVLDQAVKFYTYKRTGG